MIENLDHLEPGQKVVVPAHTYSTPLVDGSGRYDREVPEWRGVVCKCQPTRDDGMVCIQDKNGTPRVVPPRRAEVR